MGIYDELLHTYTGEIFWSGAPDDCVKGNQAGDYLLSCLFSPDLDRCKDAACNSGYNYEVWKDMKSFDSYISSYVVDNTERFYINTFNNEEDTHEANDLALSTTILDPMTSLITITVGQVVFDHTCSGNNFEFDMNDMGEDDDASDDNGGNDNDATCMTIGEIIHSHPDLVHICV